jgi:hypothetical protein
MALPFLWPELLISAETVEKPQICDLDVRNHLISLHAKLLKLQFLDFFDSLAIYLQI